MQTETWEVMMGRFSLLRAWVVISSILLTPTAFSAQAATIFVTNIADSGAGSLRNAIASASAGDTVKFNLGSNSTIKLFSTLIVDNDIVLDGADTPNLAISGGGSVEVFVVNAGVAATFANVIIAEGNVSGIDGGGINNRGNLTLIRSVMAGNWTDGNGGGIYNDTHSTATVIESNFLCNGAQGLNTSRGGAIYNRGILKVTNSDFTCNMARGGQGGGIYNDVSGTASLINTTLANNSSVGFSSMGGDGGGIYNAGTIDSLANIALVRNFVGIGGSGGGIYNSGTIVALINDTLSDNTSLIAQGGSPVAGAGIYNLGPTISLVNSIVHDCVGGATDNGGNLDIGDSCGLSAATSKSNAALNLGPLTYNGGDVISILPGTGSDAIGRGIASACSNAPVNGLDQRGAVRSSTSCTSGAAEIGGSFLLDVSVTGDGTVSDNAVPPRIHCTVAGGSCHSLYSADPQNLVSVTLVATASAGSRFVAWSGDCVSGVAGPSASVMMNGRRTCTATFEPVANAAAIATPTLDRWAVLLFGALLVLNAWAHLRKQAHDK